MGICVQDPRRLVQRQDRPRLLVARQARGSVDRDARQDPSASDLVATMVERRRDFKGCRRKTLPIFVSGADHAFQASFERQTAYSSPAPSGYKLARI